MLRGGPLSLLPCARAHMATLVASLGRASFASEGRRMGGSQRCDVDGVSRGAGPGQRRSLTQRATLLPCFSGTAQPYCMGMAEFRPLRGLAPANQSAAGWAETGLRLRLRLRFIGTRGAGSGWPYCVGGKRVAVEVHTGFGMCGRVQGVPLACS